LLKFNEKNIKEEEVTWLQTFCIILILLKKSCAEILMPWDALPEADAGTLEAYPVVVVPC